MKRTVYILLLTLITMATTAQATKTFHDFKVITLTGEEFDLSSLKGKKVLVVNTASKCGLTPQYEDLQKLYEEYGGEDFTIIGFPSNNFMKQEPGTDEEILEFCRVSYGVEFPMMSKIDVKGRNMHPVYKWLTNKEENGVKNSSVKWNFQKYMINEDGTLEGSVAPQTKPFNKKILAWIESD